MLSFLVLVCGIAASLAVGVLIAQAICSAMFRLFRMHAQHTAAIRAAASPIVALKTARNQG